MKDMRKWIEYVLEVLVAVGIGLAILYAIVEVFKVMAMRVKI